MQRRTFLKTVVPATAGATLIGGWYLKPYLNLHKAPQNEDDKVLVLVRLDGGNDGLNTLIPLDQYDLLQKARPNIIPTQKSLLSITGIDNAAFHPAAEGFQQLYNQGNLCVVQGVGYPNPNFSHFRATDVVASGSNANEVWLSGWTGRYLQSEFAGYPNGYPNTKAPHPPAIQIGSGLPLLFQGSEAAMATTISNASLFSQWNNQNAATTQTNDLKYLKTVAQQTKDYSSVLQKAFDQGNNMTTYDDTNSLADQLKLVARLISGGLKTRIYLVSLHGFDTHASQVENNDPLKGKQPELLQKTATAIKAFTDDCQKLGIDKRVTGLAFSEFGRRIKSNLSGGTDHGTAYPMFLFGNQINAGIIGKNPIIPSTATAEDNLEMQYDFRAIYASLLKDWFCVADANIDTILKYHFDTLPLIKNKCKVVA